MTARSIILLVTTLTLSTGLRGESIEGTVVIRKKLTRRRVTAPIPLYQRGPAVELNARPADDPLIFERQRVVIYLDGQGLEASTKAPLPVVTMTQENRNFSPETLVIAVGSKVSFPNLDPIFHNVFSLSKVKSFDLGNYPKGETRTVTFPEPGIVFVGCQLHSNMSATIMVTPNRWNAKADSDGRFAIHDVPPGRYTIIAWHKAAGFFRQPVQITQGHDAVVEFLIPVDENGSKLTPKMLEARGGQ